MKALFCYSKFSFAVQFWFYWKKTVLQLSFLEVLVHFSSLRSDQLFHSFILTYLALRKFSKEYSGLNGFCVNHGLLIVFSIELAHQTDLTGVLKLEVSYSFRKDVPLKREKKKKKPSWFCRFVDVSVASFFPCHPQHLVLVDV